MAVVAAAVATASPPAVHIGGELEGVLAADLLAALDPNAATVGSAFSSLPFPHR